MSGLLSLLLSLIFLGCVLFYLFLVPKQRDIDYVKRNYMYTDEKDILARARLDHDYMDFWAWYYKDDPKFGTRWEYLKKKRNEK